ncbi:hypothetical protein BaRGS_00001242 [Batillaria attramentaria]|uniref:Cadherin domain-containing protein n=1 Tax=Batillaria attramentaria TaxID=370345 RepID=A0ABD0M716_9CAEN
MFQFPDSVVADAFNTSTRIDNVTSQTVLDITLSGPLDCETRSHYTFSLWARDGGAPSLSSTAVVSVTVTDVQDTPPFFQLDTYRANITENMPVGTSIIQLSAEDGDRTFKNGIVYSIVEGNTDYFAVDNNTGTISSLVVLDRDNTSMVGREGVFALTVRATELDDLLPQYGNSTTDVFVLIVVDDVNDHVPTFSSSLYTAFVREDTRESSLVYFEGDGYISVSDSDQGRNSHFNLSVEKDGVPWSVLVPTPVEVYSEALVLLRVMDSNAIKEAVGTHISFQIVAREISTTQRHSSTAEVVITVERLTEQTTTPAPPESNPITAPDVVVFIIGFLVVFNIVVSVLIIWYMRKRSQEPKQGLVRRGSKYYVNGVAKKEAAPHVQNGSVVKPESVVVEVDARDRCDVVPLNERASFGKSGGGGPSRVNV